MIRLTKNLTQSQLADMCNFEKSTVSKIEAGQVNISYLTLYRLSEGLKVPMTKLVVDELGGFEVLIGRDGEDGVDGKKK